MQEEKDIYDKGGYSAAVGTILETQRKEEGRKRMTIFIYGITHRLHTALKLFKDGSRVIIEMEAHNLTALSCRAGWVTQHSQEHNLIFKLLKQLLCHTPQKNKLAILLDISNKKVAKHHLNLSRSQCLMKSIIKTSFFPPHLLKFLQNRALLFSLSCGSHGIFCYLRDSAQPRHKNPSLSTFLFLTHNKLDTTVPPFPKLTILSSLGYGTGHRKLPAI